MAGVPLPTITGECFTSIIDLELVMTEDFGSNYLEYQLNRSSLRKLVRRAYLRKAASHLTGPTLDFGCGIGLLLQRLPAGSRGVEYNETSVAYCRDQGLSVMYYDGFADDWSLGTLPADWQFESMVISHVLEHLDSPMEILRKLLCAVHKRGVCKALVIVPGQAGFHIDATHRTFVDIEMLRSASLEPLGWNISSVGWFPGNIRALGNYFPHHELQVLLEHQ
jgi:hypothetical protein